VAKRFNENPTIESRALQIWIILVGKAMSRQTLTYGQLADLIGFKGAGVFSQFLDPIMQFCVQSNLPPLTVIVVDQDKGTPRDGLTASVDRDSDREKVFRVDWYAITPPTTQEFMELSRKGKHVVGQGTL
jgi:putative restriction endonuclease